MALRLAERCVILSAATGALTVSLVAQTAASHPAFYTEASNGARFITMPIARDSGLLPRSGRPICEDTEVGDPHCDERGLLDAAVLDRRSHRYERISRSSKEVPANGSSGGYPTIRLPISADGRFVAFSSRATNLVPHDTNDAPDVFVRDRKAGTTQRINVSPSGAQAQFARPSGQSGLAMSANGRFVAFTTGATNLAPGGYGLVVHDRRTRRTRRVLSDTEADMDLSADGHILVYSTQLRVRSDPDHFNDVYAYDRRTGRTTRLSAPAGRPRARGGGSFPLVSADGRFVAFSSGEPLVKRDTNAAADVYVHDRRRHTIRQVSVDSRGREGELQSHSHLEDISPDGRAVAFSTNSGLAPGDDSGDDDLYVHDRRTRRTRLVTITRRTDVHRPAGPLSFSADGRHLVYWSFRRLVVRSFRPR